MNDNDVFSSARTRPARNKLSRDTVFLIGDLLPLLDFFAVLLAAYLGTLFYATWEATAAAASGILDGGGRAALAAALLAPLLLCDRAFVAFASAGQTASLVRCYAVRFLMFAGVVAAIGLASRTLAELPRTWLALWFALTLVVTALTRVQLVALLRRLERSGALAESIAVVGAGPAADRLIRHLQRTRRHSVEILGVFDDRAARHAGTMHPPSGTVADLVELGKARPMDWILVALPQRATARVDALVHRLKALSVPIGLCPQSIALDEPPAAPQQEGPPTAIEAVLPRWILTLVMLPLYGLRSLAARLRSAPPRVPALTLPLDDFDLDRFAAEAARFGQRRFGYMVNPNADHLIRLHRTPAFRTPYRDASYVLLDSRFVSHLVRLTRGQRLPVCTGSDLTARLFATGIAPDDRVVLVGGSVQQAEDISRRYRLTRLAHFNPPMGFISDSHAVDACLRFIERHSPFRYCVLAVGSPQQEAIAHQLKLRGRARGLALCVGASIDFLTGAERRAPRWLQRCGMEWLFRLLQAPRRMTERYLVRGPRLFGLLHQTRFVLRAAPPPSPTALPTRGARPCRPNLAPIVLSSSRPTLRPSERWPSPRSEPGRPFSSMPAPCRAPSSTVPASRSSAPTTRA